MQVEDISFKEVVKALKGEDGRKVTANYGLDPKLGKYHRSFCEDCNDSIEIDEAACECPRCHGKNITFGVFDRIELIKDKKETKSPKTRPPYIYQVPLTFIPGVGGKTIDKLLERDKKKNFYLVCYVQISSSSLFICPRPFPSICK